MASGMGIGLGYAAGAVNKTLEDLLEQRIKEENMRELLRQGEFSRQAKTQELAQGERRIDLEGRRVVVDEAGNVREEGLQPGKIKLQDVDVAKKTREEKEAEEAYRRFLSARAGAAPELQQGIDLGARPEAISTTDPTGKTAHERALELERMREAGAMARTREVGDRPQRGAVKIQTGVLNEKGQRVNRVIDAEGNVVSETPAAPTQGQQTRLASLSAIKDSVQEMKDLYKKEYVGPIQGRMGSLKAATVGTSTDQALFQTAADRMMNILLEARSGKQVTPQEYTRIYRELANLNKPDVNFEASLASTSTYLDSLLEREAAGVNLPGPATRPAGAVSPFPETSTQPEEYVRDPATGKLRKK